MGRVKGQPRGKGTRRHMAGRPRAKRVKSEPACTAAGRNGIAEAHVHVLKSPPASPHPRAFASQAIFITDKRGSVHASQDPRLAVWRPRGAATSYIQPPHGAARMGRGCECGICGHHSEEECVRMECSCCSNFHARSGPRQVAA